MDFYFDGYCQQIYTLYQCILSLTACDRKACLFVHLFASSAFSKLMLCYIKALNVYAGELKVCSGIHFFSISKCQLLYTDILGKFGCLYSKLNPIFETFFFHPLFNIEE